MSDPFTQDVSDRICNHMNKDHAEAVALYAQVYGKLDHATAAQMIKIDATGMDLLAQVDGEDQSLRIEFDHRLENAKDAHVTLVEMVNQARSSG
jgi:putative heme iron utilization protein